MQSKDNTPTDFYSILLVLAGMVCISTGASMAKHLFAVLGSSGTTVLRLGFGTILLCAVWRPWRARLSIRDLRVILSYGVCLGLMNFLFYRAIARLPLGIAIAIEFVGPLSVALGLSRRTLDFVWGLLATIGLVLILPLSQFQQSIDPVGVVYALAAAVTWALYILLSKKAGTLTHPGFSTSIGMAAGFVAIFPLGASEAVRITQHWELVPVAVAVGLLSSAIPYSLEMRALKRISTRHFGILMSLEPAVGAILGFLILHETLTSVQVLAIGSIIAASIGSTLFGSRRAVKVVATSEMASA